MRYEVGDYVYVTPVSNDQSPRRIVGLEYKWQGCVEKVSFCKLRAGSGVIRVPVSNVRSPGEAVAERLKGKADGHDVGV